MRRASDLGAKAKRSEPYVPVAARRVSAAQSRSHTRDELLDPIIDSAKRVLAQHGALGLVVELQVNPVDGEVAALLLRPLDEVTAQSSPRRLRRHRLGLEDAQVRRDAVHRTLALE